MHSQSPLTRDLVLIGGGHTHALVLRKWGMDRLAGARVTLINPGSSAPYTGMLPGHVAGHYAREDLDIDLVRLARFAGARFVFDIACDIDRQAKLIHLAGRAPVRYDVASIDIGATSELPEIDGFAAHAHSVKPLGPFADAWAAFLDRVTTSKSRATCVVFGGGVAGVELALAMAHRMRSVGFDGASVTIIEAGPEMLGGTSALARRVLLKALSDLDVGVLTNTRALRIRNDCIDLSDGQSLPVDFIVSAAGARPHPWLASTGLALTNGYIDVGPGLRTQTDPDIFASGDCAHLTHAPRPKAGVFAVREAPVLFDNLRAALTGTPLRDYNPQKDYLKLVSTGAKSAVGQRHFLTASGPGIWKLKDLIDTAFMSRLRNLPAMPVHAAPNVRAAGGDAEHSQPLCGGCGSKVGRASLMAALAENVRDRGKDVVTGIGGDAAVLQIGARQQVISTDHLRAFVEDPFLLARIATVHALGDVWATGASPQSALLSLIIPRMSEALQVGTVAEVVAAVREVLDGAGASLVGGHTSMGCELTVGLTVTGLLTGPAIGLGGAKPGDAIILTKAIGTGVILAADMRGLANGSVVEGALKSMQRPLAVAARLLAPVAHAMTDITGFGLAGHLISILEASNVSARVSLSGLPVLAGAEKLSAQGIRSSIWQANAALDSRVSRPVSPISDLVYDPQTAGGLLAVVPAPVATRILSEFGVANEQAYLIGEIEAGPPKIIFS